MQSTIPLLPLTLEATAAITSRRFVTLAGAVATAVDPLYGVSRSDAADGEQFTVDVFGVTTIETGGIVAICNTIGADATGRAVAVTPGVVKFAVIAGGAAGNHTVSGIAATDTLLSVLQFNVTTDTGTTASGNKIDAVADLTSEFTLSAAGTIANAGHTDTSGDTLLVVYQQNKPVGGKALSAAGAAGQFVQVLLLPQL